MDYLQEQFIGKTFTKKLNEEMNQYFCKRKFESLGFLPRPGAIAMIHTLKDGMIKNIGASAPGDIINDNFGKWLAAMHVAPNNTPNNPINRIGNGDNPVKTDGTNGSTIYFYNNEVSTYLNGAIAKTQIGQGLTAAAVDDFAIETPFVGGPEANITNIIGTGAYNPSSGQVSLAFSIGPTIQVGTISEAALFHSWNGINYMISHDNINPTIPFAIGETIFVQYFFQL